jgi:hypothetical protein
MSRPLQPARAVPAPRSPAVLVLTLIVLTGIVLALGGCHLVDRGDLPVALGGAPPPVVKVAAKPVPKPEGPEPLLTIRFGPGVYYDTQLRDAVAQARARKPDVTFDVVTAVPATGDSAAAFADAEQDSGGAQQVARDIERLGVPPARVFLSAQISPTITEREVRVYVR